MTRGIRLTEEQLEALNNQRVDDYLKKRYNPARVEKRQQLERNFLFQLEHSSLWCKTPIPPWERQYRFHPEREWRFDFAWPDFKIAVEIEGGTWVKGAHTRGAHFESDCEKYAEALCLGWKVLRITTDQVKSTQGLKWLERLFQ